MSGPAAQRALRVLPAVVDAPPLVSFCGHCGQRSQGDGRAAKRVCGRCHMGLVLQAAPDLAPQPGDPFMVIDRSLTLCALSRSAERLLDMSETQAINRHISEFLIPADAEARGPEDLVTAILTATGGEQGPHHVVVRPTGEFGVRLWVRIGHCGPPSAALLVMADSRH